MFYGKDCGVKIVETFHSNRKNQRRCSHKKIKYLKTEQKNKKKFVFFVQKFAIFVLQGDR